MPRERLRRVLLTAVCALLVMQSATACAASSTDNGANQTNMPARKSAPTKAVTTPGVAQQPPSNLHGLGSKLPTRLPQSSGVGGTFFVDGTNGSESGTGSSTHPWKTMTQALELVPGAGSIIKVRPGTYTSNGTEYALVFHRNANVSDPITLMAEQPGTVRIRNADLSRSTLGAWIFHSTGLRVEGVGLLLTAEESNITVNSVLVEDSDRIEFTGNTFHQSGSFQVRGGKVSGDVAEDIWLYANIFRPSGDDVYAQSTGNSHLPNTYAGSKGSHYVYAGQVGDVDKGFDYVSGAERFVVANNVFAGTAAGRHVELGPQARNSFVVNNTFYGNHAGGVIGWDTGAAYAGEGVVLYANTESSVPAANRNNTVTNNLFVELSGHAVYGSGPTQAGNLVQHNMSWAIENARGMNGAAHDDFAQLYGNSVLFGEGTGNREEVNPLLADPIHFDFTLRAGSPAIGGADPAYTPPQDNVGAARDGEPDLGALEQTSAPSGGGSESGGSKVTSGGGSPTSNAAGGNL
ncbi:MAG: DUF1565 domain-containing protein, partial [Thermoleophilia bacterium]|nr:DUF1565 domain-containing protein [Thermoleophilia bacterium]